MPTQAHIYTVMNKNLYRQLDKIIGWRDVRKKCVYHKDIGHNTMKRYTLKDEIGRLIRVGHFSEFKENELQIATRNEQLRQQSPERLREILTIFRGPYVTGESWNARDRYTKEA